jgi:mono/diheme cytochrome c family protein
MRLPTVVWAILLVLIVSLGCFAEAKGDATKGKEVFLRCSVCHGDSGEGKEAIGKAFGVTMIPLSSKAVQSLDDATLKKGIIEGKGKMRPVSLSDAEAADVIAFLRTLKK